MKKPSRTHRQTCTRPCHELRDLTAGCVAVLSSLPHWC
uniref:Uncharacterized protein n=1 Tax=Anguilla anguilla TaxID=7936 RepID=A0A0E9QBD1_ANGAN